jgi:hypothetical protein
VLQTHIVLAEECAAGKSRQFPSWPLPHAAIMKQRDMAKSLL